MFRPTQTKKRHQIPTPPRWATWRTNLIALAATTLATVAALAFAPMARAAAPVTVTIGDSLEPASLTVRVGTVVVFRNTGDERHRMRPTPAPRTSTQETSSPARQRPWP